MMLDLTQRARLFSKQKELGQNFLISDQILDQIIEVSQPANRDTVIEIGAGIGFLTERLVKQAGMLKTVELDAQACTHLELIEKLNSNFSYLNQDILQTDFKDLLGERGAEILAGKQEAAKIIANIPYQITTKILLHIFGEIAEPKTNQDYIKEIYVLVQREYAERLMASPGEKQHAAITLYINYWAEVEYLFDVPSYCFDPEPKVQSAFIKLTKRPEPLIKTSNPKVLRRFIKAIYANRRKVLTNSLKAAGYSKEQIDCLDLSTNLRGETLNLEQINAYIEKLSTME
jgi:16S rRNA (adenine1518-N6/adenine1519-N6)-dimethyltransferase